MQSPELGHDEALLRLMDQECWTLKTNLPHCLMLSVPKWADAQWLAEAYGEVLMRWANRATVYFEYENYLMQLSEQGDLMDVQVDGIAVNRALWDVFGEMLSSPERSLSLVHIPTQRQISVSGGSGGRFLLNARKEQATQWTRDQYWMPDALAEFNRALRREMSPDSDLWFEWKYKIDSQAPLEDRTVVSAEHELVTRYRLVLGPNEEPYHLGENLDMIEIAGAIS